MSAVVPRLDVRPARIAEPDEGLLDIHWRVTNRSDAPVSVLESWLPHGGFFAGKQALQPALELITGEGAEIRRAVRCTAGPGQVVENAFLILAVRLTGRPWRVLSRVRVNRSRNGTVKVAVESITAQPMGFAQPFDVAGSPSTGTGGARR